MKVLDIKNTHDSFKRHLDLNYRISSLQKFKNSILKYEKELLAALKKDLNKSEKEGFLAEVNEVISEINYHIKHLKSWSKPKKVKNTIATLFTKCTIVPKPKGKALIVSPFNYPFNLSMMPLVGAISAGNNVLMKLSTLVPYVNEVIYKIIDDSFDKRHVAYVKPNELSDYDEIFEYKPNILFFTGSTTVGKKLELKCVQNNIEYITEMGGACPCIVKEINDVFVQRMVWTKFLNAGQTCVTINHIIINKKLDWKSLFLKEINNQYPNALQSKNIPRVINEKEFNRLVEIIEKNKENVVIGGNYNRNTLIIEPTIIKVTSVEQIINEKEIFGPIIFVYETDNDIKKMVSIANQINDCPLAAYLYSNNKEDQSYFFDNINAGGYCINDSLTQILNHNLPFGGVYNSGFGQYHGQFSFNAFSFLKPVLVNNNKKENPIKFINNDIGYEKTKKTLTGLSKFIKG